MLKYLRKNVLSVYNYCRGKNADPGHKIFDLLASNVLGLNQVLGPVKVTGGSKRER